jgi:DNA repair exonuclease SbcCD ATPase subunit
MAGQRWVPVAVELRGYGGVGANSLALRLDRPLIVLSGPNGSGKSTIVSAIEWALFGELAVGGDFDITDLKGGGTGPHLVYLNRRCDEAEVVVRFEGGGSSLEWRRTRRRATPRLRDDVVECTIDGSSVAADSLALLGVTPELYCRAVAPRQASLTALVSLESKQRNAALDRLFGIEELNLLAEGLSRAKLELPRSLNKCELRLDQAESGLRDEITQRFDLRAKARGDALEAGIENSQLSLEDCRSLAATLARELALPTPPERAGLSELRTLHQQLVKAADAAWSRPEPQNRWDRLTRVQGILERGAPALWTQAIASRDEARRSLETLRAQLGTETEVEVGVHDANARVERVEHELSAANERAAILGKGRQWLQQHEPVPEEEVDCPVCERPIVATELAGLVDAALNGLEESDGAIAGLLAEEGEARAVLGATLAHKERLDQAVRDLRDREQSVTGRRFKLPEAVEEALKPWRAKKPDDVEARTVELLREVLNDATTAYDGVLDRQLSHLASACSEAVSRTNKELQEAGSLAQQRRGQVVALERLLDFLQAAESLDALDADVSEVELAQARDSLGTAHRAADVLAKVTVAAGEVAEVEAKARTAAVAAELDRWFGRVSVHDRLRGARIDVQTTRAGGRLRNSYRLRAVDPRGSWQAAPGPMLSGAYQTLLAVAALCALADAAGRRLDMLVLDEPTLSLDPELTGRLGKALAMAVPAARTVVATADPVFTRAILESAGEQVSVVALGPWTEAAGTQVTIG